ncbi:MAG: radical SAM protein [Deltaproteobacteria bacterium]|nr:radical SAM protein [Deltaproteobacteria bacterium]
MSRLEPAYIKTYQAGKLKEKIKRANAILSECKLCPRQCGVNRLEGEVGLCRTGKDAVVASYDPHFGEEDPLVGQHGSGTVFFSNCNLLCIFCQNYDISHQGVGREVLPEELAKIFLALQSMGCHNINFVTPTHVVPQILSALDIAIEGGLHLPLVYNSSGYDLCETLQILDGIIDIYMPDFKFWDHNVAKALCNASDYPKVARKALKEMHRQVGDLVITDEGLAERGLLIRHLVLPEGLAGTRAIMRFLAKEISRNSYVNVMAQYRPCGQAHKMPPLNRELSGDEYDDAVRAAKEEGITRLDQRKRVFLFR